MANEMDKSHYMDYVEYCIDDIEKRGNDIINKTMEVKTELIRFVKERQHRDRSVIEERFRSGNHTKGNNTSPAIFRPGAIDLSSINELYGDILLSYENGKFSLSTNKSFEIKHITNIRLIIPTNNSKAWIYGDSNEGVKVNQLGSIEKSIFIDSVEHASRQGNEIIVTSSDMLTIRRIQENGTIRSEMTTSPLFPLGTHVTDDGDILVCLVDRCDFSVTTKSRRLIMIYHHMGIIPTELEYEKGNRIFTLPNRVTSSKKNVIAIDVQSRTRSRILCLSHNGKIIFEFSRQGHFCPCDVCATPDQEILVLDEATHSIYVLNIDGLVLSTVRLSDFCIEQPTTMAFDTRNNELWLGHSSNKITIFTIGDVSKSEKVHSELDPKEITNVESEETWF
ncbi:unnamed protein product [Mytilus edulis]|uniref:Uncharacterized protein n=1 Tax=Mytilus edulis TaxID=6550 RepID=A0A8S3RA92_MYTED|nr:unnamed protein product [Mytilus edulis]